MMGSENTRGDAARPAACLWLNITNDPYVTGKLVARSLDEMDPNNPPYPHSWKPDQYLYTAADYDALREEVERLALALYKANTGFEEHKRLYYLMKGRAEAAEAMAREYQFELLGAWDIAQNDVDRMIWTQPSEVRSEMEILVRRDQVKSKYERVRAALNEGEGTK